MVMKRVKRKDFGRISSYLYTSSLSSQWYLTFNPLTISRTLQWQCSRERVRGRNSALRIQPPHKMSTSDSELFSTQSGILRFFEAEIYRKA